MLSDLIEGFGWAEDRNSLQFSLAMCFQTPGCQENLKHCRTSKKNRIRTESKYLGQNHMGRWVSNQIKDISWAGGWWLGDGHREGMFKEKVRAFGRPAGGTAGDGEELGGACGHMGPNCNIKDGCSQYGK